MAYRVIQWATGSIGTQALKIICDHPDLELAGVLVYSAAKDGKDAGELCDRPSTGVRATRDIDALLAIDADVVIHSPSLDPKADVHGEIERILRAGKNVITHRGYIWPPGESAAFGARFQAAGEAGNATLFGTGINPGFFNDRIVPAMTSVCSVVRSIEYGTAFDLSARSPLALKTCAIGIPMDDVTLDMPVVRTMDDVYREGINLTAEQMGCRIRRITQEVVPSAATRDMTVNGLFVKKGTVGGVKWRWRAEMEKGPSLSYEFRFFVDHDLPGWDTRHVRTVRIDGDPPLYAEFDLGAEHSPNAKEPYLPVSRGMAALAINAIPEVVAAPPGVMKPTIFAPWRARFI